MSLLKRIGMKYDTSVIGIELEDAGELVLILYTLSDIDDGFDARDAATEITEKLASNHDCEVSRPQFRNVERLCQKLYDRHIAAKLVERDGDLNGVSVGVLEQAKQLMNNKYSSNFVKRDDSEFEYDKKVEFEVDSDEDNSWDDS